MSLVERARQKVEEVRARGPMTVMEEKFPKLREFRGGGGHSSPQLPTLKEVREKGVLGVLEEKFPKVKEIRETGIIARLRGGSPATSPPGPSPPVLDKQEVRVRGSRVLL